MLLYSICYYYGKNNKKNIVNHIKEFIKVKNVGDLFVLTVMIDSHDQTIHQNVKNELSEIITNNSIINYIILLKICFSYNNG